MMTVVKQIAVWYLSELSAEETNNLIYFVSFAAGNHIIEIQGDSSQVPS